MVRASALVFIALTLAGCGLALTPEQKLEQKTKEAVSGVMKDPSSAQFRSLDVYPRSSIVCGEVNAKNSFGAMAGFEGFVYDGERVWLASEDDIEFARARLRCADASLDEIDPEGSMKRANERSKAELEKMVAALPEGEERDALQQQVDTIGAPAD